MKENLENDLVVSSGELALIQLSAMPSTMKSTKNFVKEDH